MNNNGGMKSQAIIIVLVIAVVFFGLVRYRQVMGDSYYRTGTTALQEGQHAKAEIYLKKALALTPKSSWAGQARNELSFCQIVLGESTAPAGMEIFSLTDWLSSPVSLAMIAAILGLLSLGIFYHFKRRARIRKLEEYVVYLKRVEHRIKAHMNPSIEGMNKTTFDGSVDYENYINYYKRSEYATFAKCVVGEFHLKQHPNDIDLIQSLEKSYLEFAKGFPDSKLHEETQQKLANLYFFTLDNYEQAKAVYKWIIEKYPQSKWVKIAQARSKLIEDNPEGNYDPLRYYIKAERYYEDKKYPESLEQFEKLIATFSESKLAVESQYAIADIYMFKTNQTDRAIAEYQKIIDHYGQSPFAGKSQYKIGECYKKLQKYPEAIKAYESFIVNYPQTEFLDYAYYYIGYCCEQIKDAARALEIYKKILQDFSGSIWVVVAESRIAALTPK